MSDGETRALIDLVRQEVRADIGQVRADVKVVQHDVKEIVRQTTITNGRVTAHDVRLAALEDDRIAREAAQDAVRRAFGWRQPLLVGLAVAVPNLALSLFIFLGAKP